MSELKKYATGNGWIQLRCEGRRYRVVRTAKRDAWEVAIYDNDCKDWLLCSGQTPEGEFRTRALALNALSDYLVRNPPPPAMERSHA